MAHNPRDLQLSEAPDHVSTATSFEIDSITPSQSSSFNDSIASQQSAHQRPPNSKAHTPATTLSNNSSQEHAMISDDTSGIIIHEEERTVQNTLSPSAATSSYDPSRLIFPHQSHTSTPKRLVNGEIKPPYSNMPTSPTDSSPNVHSRNSSTTSRSSQIGELSTQLRTRLSYAMVKVQHGWQGHKISELEQMTSQQNSPTSAASDRLDEDMRFAGSPARPTPESRSHNFPTASTTLSLPRASSKQAMVERPGSGSSSQAGTYESFWREHASSAISSQPPAQNNPLSGPTLAPPVDILPRIQHPKTSHKRPAQLQTKILPQPVVNTPSTPQRRPAAGMRTPSQQAAVEKDAVETLLFMSSPGNSSYYPSNRSIVTSPRFPAMPDHRMPTIYQNQYNMRADVNAVNGIRSPFPAKPLSEHDMDKLLDEMPEGSSDEEYDDDVIERGH